jgi:hypothetical protein
LVSHQLQNGTDALPIPPSQLSQDPSTLVFVRMVNALFHNIARKLVLGEYQDLLKDNIDNMPPISRFAVLDNVLHNVIPV